VGRKRRIEIRISVHQTLKIGSPTSVSRVWCARCAEHVEMIEMERLNQLDPQALQASGIQIDADRLHVTSPTEGPPLVCLRSLMQ
jgi:hypothetical protein